MCEWFNGIGKHLQDFSGQASGRGQRQSGLHNYGGPWKCKYPETRCTQVFQISSVLIQSEPQGKRFCQNMWASPSRRVAHRNQIHTSSPVKLPFIQSHLRYIAQSERHCKTNMTQFGYRYIKKTARIFGEVIRQKEKLRLNNNFKKTQCMIFNNRNSPRW